MSENNSEMWQCNAPTGWAEPDIIMLTFLSPHTGVCNNLRRWIKKWLIFHINSHPNWGYKMEWINHHEITRNETTLHKLWLISLRHCHRKGNLFLSERNDDDWRGIFGIFFFGNSHGIIRKLKIFFDFNKSRGVFTQFLVLHSMWIYCSLLSSVSAPFWVVCWKWRSRLKWKK